MNTKKCEWSRNGMHLLVNTSCKTFNRQTTAIGNGNIWATTEFSNYIRGRLETECNGFTFPVGHLRDCDLKPYREALLIPVHVLNKVLEATNGHESVCLACIFHKTTARYPNKSKRIIHGWIITEGYSKHHALIAKFVTGRTHKSWDVIQKCLPYIVEDYQEKVS